MFFYTLDYLLCQFQGNPVWLNRFKWFANINMYISAILISFSVSFSSSAWAFGGFFVAHVIWLAAATAMKDKPLMALNGFFIPLDLYAMAIRL